MASSLAPGLDLTWVQPVKTLASECPEEEPGDFPECMSEVSQDEGPWVVLRKSQNPGSGVSMWSSSPPKKHLDPTLVVKQ